MGSRVIRGNLLVVPIKNSMLYVSPLYLRAETGQLPELKRVIAAYGDRVVMEETLPGALAALFKESAKAGGSVRYPPCPPNRAAGREDAYLNLEFSEVRCVCPPFHRRDVSFALRRPGST